MATVSERSRGIATKAVFSADGNHVKTFDADSLSLLIEQALLAERRLAKLEDAEIAEAAMSCDCGSNDADSGCPVFIAKEIAAKLRAAAEKEVAK